MFTPKSHSLLRRLNDYITVNVTVGRKLNTYSEVGKALGMAPLNAHTSTAMNKLTEYDLMMRHPLRCAAIVRAGGDPFPAPEFFDFVENVTGKGIKDRRKFWNRELRRLGIKVPVVAQPSP